MPKKMEESLKKEANKHKGWSKERKDRYVYGTMRKTGWKPEREKKVKAEKSSTTGKDVVKVGRFETRLTLDDTKLPQSVKEQIKERGIGEFVSMSDEQSYDLARKNSRVVNN